jgi:hypothetical protein
VSALRRWAPSLGLFLAVQALAMGWLVAEVHHAQLDEALWRTFAGPFNLLSRLDRLFAYFRFPRDALLLLLLAGIAVLPWTHAWRARWWTLALSLLGSVLWAAAGFGFTIDHL